eukprot:TRINITY_DN4516_c0_g1_i1.p1 TRINITY_DN4516_c0_g1~~TRINITY_DN4516_c0_g1_i1.p1  ORF type:complete len:211 (-),score=30.01 TRINITY_DN4516_c0_g1_i1:109-741(-)
MEGESVCAFCARMKRGSLYTCARTQGYNVLALAQHLDDFAESWLMSAFRNGQLRTMKAHYSTAGTGAGDTDLTDDAADDADVRAGEAGGSATPIRIIRPFAYVRERETKEFSVSSRLPVINDNCPACFIAPTERARVKKVLAREESMMPALFDSLRRALMPLMDPQIHDALEARSAAITRMRAEFRKYTPTEPPVREKLPKPKKTEGEKP